ncbi:MAG: hypothetical protein FWD76_00915 [Firmicutes bacterium]|nr:hypothetical protein [Bacillota bacterium]
MIVSGKTKRYRELIGYNIYQGNTAQRINPQLVSYIIEPTNAIVASIGVMEVVKYFSGICDCALQEKVFVLGMNGFVQRDD